MALNSNEIMALDVGSKRIGVARANTVAKIPEALGIVSVDDLVMDNILKIITAHQPHLLLIGLPANMEGKETKQTSDIRQWSETLTNYLAETDLKDIKVAFADESFSSVTARERSGSVFSKKSQTHIDDQAACVILDYYLGN